MRRFSRDPDTLRKSRSAELFRFILINFKVMVKSFTVGLVSETEQEGFRYHLGYAIS